MAFTRNLLAVLLSVLLSSTCSIADYEPAGCSDEGCGIPCYMRPVEDPCHYQPHSPCNEDGSTDLEQWVRNLNSSLHRLENKLIQKGVIPAGETCTPLSPIENGGIIYSDLLLSPGVIANYVCEQGYSIRGHPSRTCAPDGGWIGSENGDPVCNVSLVECTPLLNIPFGHVHYTSVDTTIIQPGDVVTYSCDPPYILKGANYRICMSNASWSEKEPQCIEPSSSSGGNTNSQGRSTKPEVIAGAVVGVLLGVIFASVIIAVVALVIRRKRTKGGYEKLPSNTSGQNRSGEEHTDLVEESVKTKQSGSSNIKLHTETIMAES